MIKSITATNFQSWPELHFEIPRGVSLIKGYNYDDKTAEACGKSSLLNAICWALFGQIPKDVKIDDVIKEGTKTCSVTITLVNGVEITRSRRPNSLSILKEGRVIEGKDSRDTQKLIEKETGFTYDTFLQSVYFAQNSMVKFLLLNENGKAKILSEIAACDIFDEGRKKAHELARECILKANVAQNKVESFNGYIALSKRQIESLREVRSKLQDESLRNIGMLELKRDDIKQQIESLGDIEDLPQGHNDRLNDAKQQLKWLQENIISTKVQISQQNEKQAQKTLIIQEIEQIKDRIVHVNKHSEDIDCHTCGSLLQNTQRNQYLKSYEEQLSGKQQQIQQLEAITDLTLIQTLESFLKSNEIVENECKILETEHLHITHRREKYTFLAEVLKRTEQDIINERHKEHLDLQQRIDLLQQDVYKNEFEQKRAFNDLQILLNKQKMYESIKDGFKEVKSLAFQEVLTELNNRTNYYLSELFEQSVEIQFSNVSKDGDVSKIETTVLINGESRHLGLFSGGQTKRIMLAVDLAISNILYSQIANEEDKLLILDEYFKDLSEESMIKICQLLTNFTGNVILIEHNSIINNLAGNIIEIEYKNGSSRIKSDL